jgi:hypothetical protein
MLQRIRQWSQALVWLDVVFMAALCSAVVVFAILAALIALARDDAGQLRMWAVEAAVAVAVLALSAWIMRDARRSARAFRRDAHRENARSEEVGDVGDIVGMPKNPPWMG